MEFTALPTFRIAGISQSCLPNQAADVAQTLRTTWLAQPPVLSTFSQTLYCVYHYQDKHVVKITVGKLVSNDTMLPEPLTDVWIAPQQYAVFSLLSDSQATWKHINTQTLARRFYIDFETYPQHHEAKIYVGLEGEVQMMEM